MVSLLIIGLILPYDRQMIEKLRGQGVVIEQRALDALFWGAIVVSVLGLAWAVWQSKRETPDTSTAA